MRYARSPVFWYGVIFAVAATWALHHFAVPLPGTGKSPAAKRANGG